jgi:hypothetical protein
MILSLLSFCSIKYLFYPSPNIWSIEYGKFIPVWVTSFPLSLTSAPLMLLTSKNCHHLSYSSVCASVQLTSFSSCSSVCPSVHLVPVRLFTFFSPVNPHFISILFSLSFNFLYITFNYSIFRAENCQIMDFERGK